MSKGILFGLIRVYNLFRYLTEIEIRKTKEYNQYLKKLKNENPKIVAGFSPEGYREMVLMQAASDLGIPTLIMIRSRDNLVSKIAFLPKVEQYLFWSDYHKTYFLHLYPELADKIIKVIGSPQFSRHLNEKYRLTIEEFYAQLGLERRKKLVVFFLENPIVYPQQKKLVIAISQLFDEGKLIKNAQLLIRNHPRVFGSDYDPLNGKNYKNVTVYPKPTSVPFGKHDSEIVKHILEDEPMHLATIAYQDLNVNIFSTTIIDSAIFGKPIINICYDQVKLDDSISITRFFKRTDFDIIKEIGATDIVYSLSDLIDRINYNLDNPTSKHSERKKLISLDLGNIDESSNTKLINCFTSILKNQHE